MLAALAEDRLLLLAEGAALLALQLGDGVVGLALPLVAEALVEHQRQDVVLVVLPRGLAAQDVRRAPEVGFELLEGELHAGPRSARKYRRFGSCGPVPTSRTSPRPTRRASRVRVARGVRSIASAISLVERPLSPERRGEDGLVGVVEHGAAHPRGGDRDPEACRQFFEDRRREPGLAAGGGHALDAAAPLLDQAERVEDAADHPVAQLRDAARQILEREAEGQEARVLDLEAVVEDREAQRRAALRVVGVGHRVDDRLAHRHGRQVPALLAAHGADLGAVQGVLLDEGDRLLDGAHGKGADLGAIDDAALVGACEPAGLDPGVREVALAIPPNRIMPPTVGTLRPWWSVTSRRVSRSRRASFRKAANDSEAARKSRASESSPGMGCSSKPSPRAKRRSSSISSASARRLVEPTRT